MSGIAPAPHATELKRRTHWGVLSATLALSCTVGCADERQNAWQRDPRPLLTNFVNMYNPLRRRDRWPLPLQDVVLRMGNRRGQPGRARLRRHLPRPLQRPAPLGGLLQGRVVGRHHDPVEMGTCPPRQRPLGYEAWHVGDPSVVLHDGRFYMAYSATSKPLGKIPGYPAGMVQCIMGAVSQDGIRWSRTGSPLLIRPQDTPAPSAEPGRIGDFHRPCLRWDRGRWRLWFDYWLPGKGVCMGHAENRGDFTRTNGFSITHDLRKPLLENWPNPEVVEVGGEYRSFADPPGYPTRPGDSPWKSRQLREAVSPDGLAWRKLAFIPPDPDADACHVPQALITNLDGRRWLYLFYATQVGTRKGDGLYHYHYDRIRAMRREITATAPQE